MQLSQEIFNRPDCPPWAKRAQISRDGWLSYSNMTTSQLRKIAESGEPVKGYKSVTIPFEDFDASAYNLDLSNTKNWCNHSVDKIPT